MFGWINPKDIQMWLIGVPVFIGFIGILAIGGWIGWTMATTPLPKPIEEIRDEKLTEILALISPKHPFY